MRKYRSVGKLKYFHDEMYDPEDEYYKETKVKGKKI